MHKFMRLLVFFDLPIKTKEQRRVATGFRAFLLKDGYHMVQYSVYARVCCGNDAIEKHVKRLQAHRPPNGSARVLILTEKQYENMILLIGERVSGEESPADEQLSIF